LKNPLHQERVVVLQNALFLCPFATWASFTQFVDVVVISLSFKVVPVDIIKKSRGYQIFLR
jgi:hypothetical protein